MQNTYFERYAYPERFISAPIKENTFLSVVIPIFKETGLLKTLESLDQCEGITDPVEVLLVVNHPENTSEVIKNISYTTVEQIAAFQKKAQSTFITYHVIKAFDLPAQQAGVGLARKIGMDEAAFRLNSIGQDGVIACFDADSLCENNYLQVITSHFRKYPSCPGAAIHYEHPLAIQTSLREPIILYELHLRYYIQALRYAGYPYAFHTIGSSMAVKSSVYQKQGGMNQRKAGEDFYFLHKIIPLGGFSNITETTVIPSPRQSDRVPFGTGRAMQEYQNNQKDLTFSYNFSIFKEVKIFFEQIGADAFPEIGSQPILDFLEQQHFIEVIQKIKEQSTNAAHFKERFFQWFNGFRALKCVHFLRDHYYPNELLVQGVRQLVEAEPEIGESEVNNSSEDQLLALRLYEKGLG
jgi:hypothetical protein